jgi:uncharacterized protein with ParB-like and HNH nuclease domain
MNEFIFSIKSIFCGNDAFCKEPKYYIAPYQRGYKWAAEDEFDQVPQLLNDTYEAYTQNAENYFLQFITVKYDKQQGYEVIDGQQRLTTLSLLFYLLPEFSKENIAKDKVTYSRYKEGNVFDEVVKHIKTNEDESQDKNIKTQDFYYLVRGGRWIKKKLQEYKDDHTLDDYINYLQDKVMIILNQENEFTSAEEIFMNLNDNRVPLTDIYLIKGLLLTLAVRREDANHISYSYEEILSQRTVMGRMWDEIYSWFSIPDVSHYFFKDDKVGMRRVLELAIESDPINDNNNYKLFNLYNEKVKSADDAFKKLQKIKEIYLRLKDIYEDNSLYNMLGFVLFSEKGKFDLKDILDKSKNKIQKTLSKRIVNSIPKLERLEDSAPEENKKNFLNDTTRHPDLRYDGKHTQDLKNLLLAFSVFPEIEDKSYRFDFCSYHRENWSFEHISPQHPKSEIKIGEVAKRIVIDKIIKDSKKDKDTINDLIQQIENNKQINSNDIEFLYDGSIDLDSLGNMALLSSRVNSSLSNNPYIAKRSILFNIQNEGKFVPRHTIDVFNKILNTPSDMPFTSDIHEWKDEDIKAHIAWMEARYDKIIDTLKTIQK